MQKNKKIAITYCVVFVLTCSQVFAASYVNGNSSGGSSGRTSCNGLIATYRDYAIAATNTNTSYGTKAIQITARYSGDSRTLFQDFSGYAASVSERLDYNLVPGPKPTHITARHSFSSSQHGSWYKTTSINY